MFDVQHTAFPVTDWRMVFATGAEQSSGPAHQLFCEQYWYPVYAFIRRSWPATPPEDALEVTQEFFTRRLAKRDLHRADPKNGQFRNWIMGAVTNLLRNLHKRERAKKRDRRALVWIDAAPAEARLRLEPQTSLDPLQLLERDLALAILERALACLAAEYRARGEGPFFERAACLLVPGEGSAPYSELERHWGLSEQTLKVRVNTMRNRFGKLVRRELGISPGEARTERDQLVWLFQALDPKCGPSFGPERSP
jgi:DNA-directed RNA polymerase specialized sigma24 family protein